jgi:hypothetical protein
VICLAIWRDFIWQFGACYISSEPIGLHCATADRALQIGQTTEKFIAKQPNKNRPNNRKVYRQTTEFQK